jgi:23S rRNA pseudouridine1911/1915/1917 synthase
LRAPPPPFAVLDENADWIAVDKPAFLQVHPSKPSDERTLWHGLRDLLAFELVCGGQISIINRLDRETSGVTLIAKTRTAAGDFGRLMSRREIRKSYLALAWGWPLQDCWEVQAPILRQGERAPSRIYLKQMVHPDGAAATTQFEVVRRFSKTTSAGERFSLIRAAPVTGRMHQLRVHLAHSGHPIVGDKIYGPDEGCYLEFIETGWTASLASRLLLPRHALHSASLDIESRGLRWEAPLPPDLAAFAQE